MPLDVIGPCSLNQIQTHHLCRPHNFLYWLLLLDFEQFYQVNIYFMAISKAQTDTEHNEIKKMLWILIIIESNFNMQHLWLIDLAVWQN